MLLYQYDQESAASTWTITLADELTAVAIDVYVDVSGTMTHILPASVTKTSNQIVVEFSTPQVGFALIRGSTGVFVDYTGHIPTVENAIDYTHTSTVERTIDYTHSPTN